MSYLLHWPTETPGLACMRGRQQQSCGRGHTRHSCRRTGPTLAVPPQWGHVMVLVMTMGGALCTWAG
eukprot:1162127-Pelagomonas_calceolata.AAC.1